MAGQPVGWCISDRETTEVIEIFLRCIKEACPDTEISVVMTDDGSHSRLLANFCYGACMMIDNTGWAAPHKVFGDSVRHLLCSWHIHRYMMFMSLLTIIYCYS